MTDQNPSGLSNNAAGGIAYITIIPAIVFLIMEPFKRSYFVRFQAWQSIFFFVAWAVVNILIGVVQQLVPSGVFLTLTIMQLVGLAIFVVWLVLFIGAFGGKLIKLPSLATSPRYRPTGSCFGGAISGNRIRPLCNKPPSCENSLTCRQIIDWMPAGFDGRPEPWPSS